MIISVEKNLHNPQFLQNPYTKTITETLSINSEVLTLLATDSDMKVSVCNYGNIVANKRMFVNVCFLLMLKHTLETKLLSFNRHFPARHQHG